MLWQDLKWKKNGVGRKLTALYPQKNLDLYR